MGGSMTVLPLSRTNAWWRWGDHQGRNMIPRVARAFVHYSLDTMIERFMKHESYDTIAMTVLCCLPYTLMSEKIIPRLSESGSQGTSIDTEEDALAPTTYKGHLVHQHRGHARLLTHLQST